MNIYDIINKRSLKSIFCVLLLFFAVFSVPGFYVKQRHPSVFGTSKTQKWKIVVELCVFGQSRSPGENEKCGVVCIWSI